MLCRITSAFIFLMHIWDLFFLLHFFIQYKSWERSNSAQCDEVQAACRAKSKRRKSRMSEGKGEAWIDQR